MPEISIIIPTFSERRHLLNRCLSSCNDQLIEPSEFEVIVVDLDNLGVNAKRNIGLQRARGEVVLFLDDDCWLPRPNFLAELIAAHHANPGAVGIGGPYLSAHSANRLDRYYNEYTNLWLRSWREESAPLLGGNASYKRSLLPAHLHFDEKIYYGGSESPWNLSLLAQGGHLIALDELAVYHQGENSWLDYSKKAWRQGEGRESVRVRLNALQNHREWSRPLRMALKAGPAVLLFAGIFFFLVRLAGFWRRLRKCDNNPSEPFLDATPAIFGGRE